MASVVEGDGEGMSESSGGIGAIGGGGDAPGPSSAMLGSSSKVKSAQVNVLHITHINYVM